MDNTLLVTLFSILMLPGIAGVLLPFVPGIPYMFLVSLLYGFADRFTHLAGQDVLILAVILIVSIIVDYSAGVIGAKYGGANWRSLGIGLLGFIVGIFVFPPLGGIIGLFVGIVIAEIAQRKTRQHALRAATASLVGSLTGALVNFVLAVAFLICFIVFALN